MELTIAGEIYQFKFGMGFLREINKQAKVPVADVPDFEKNVGLAMAVGNLIDGDVETLADVLFIGNRGQKPRLTMAAIEAYIDDPDTDIDELFDMVLDFLEHSNACRKTVRQMKTEAEKLAANQ